MRQQKLEAALTAIHKDAQVAIERAFSAMDGVDPQTPDGVLAIVRAAKDMSATVIDIKRAAAEALSRD